MVNLTTVCRRVDTTGQPLLLLIAFMMRIVFDLFLISNLGIICLFYYLSTFLLARGKEVLNGDVILWLNLYMLLLIECVLYRLSLFHRLSTSVIRATGRTLILLCFLLVALYQVVNMRILSLTVILAVMSDRIYYFIRALVETYC